MSEILAMTFYFAVLIALYHISVSIYNQTVKANQQNGTNIKNRKYAKIIRTKYKAVPSDELIAADCLLNFRCQQVSRFKAIQNPNYTIARGYLINKNDTTDVIAHFINYDTKTKTYLDFTYGPYLDQYHFYLVDNNVILKTSDDADNSLIELQDKKKFLTK